MGYYRRIWDIWYIYPNKITLHWTSPSIKPPRSETQRPTKSRPHPLSNIEYPSANSVSNPRGRRFELLDPASYVLLMRFDVRGGWTGYAWYIIRCLGMQKRGSRNLVLGPWFSELGCYPNCYPKKRRFTFCSALLNYWHCWKSGSEKPCSRASNFLLGTINLITSCANTL
jgi:hypothetical protein